jgi:hypothetical protein
MTIEDPCGAPPRPRQRTVQYVANPMCCDIAEEECDRHPTCDGCPADRPNPPSVASSPSESDEVRVVDPVTGGEKGQKLARYSLIPMLPLRLLAEHYGRGARKYADRNWERGYKWSLSFDALCRHLFAFWNGEDIDPETGSPHLTAVAWHAFALQEFSFTHPAGDDRPRQMQ